MKRLGFLAAIFIAGFLVFSGSFNGILKSNSNSPSPSIATQSQNTLGEKVKNPIQTIGIPQTLIIPKLNINAHSEQVGLDKEGKMDVPKDVDNVGWYNLGFKPGERGSAVMAGHFDKVDGSPAVFYNISTLEIGDELIVKDKNNKEYRFRVTDKKLYDFDKVPLQQVFASTDKVRLNLITCDGVFNQQKKNYSQRLVIYSELVK